MCIMLHAPMSTPNHQPILPFWLHKRQKLKFRPHLPRMFQRRFDVNSMQCMKKELITWSTQGNKANRIFADLLRMAFVDRRINLLIHAVFVMILGKSRPMTQISPCCRNAIWKGRWSAFQAYSQLQTTRWRILACRQATSIHGRAPIPKAPQRSILCRMHLLWNRLQSRDRRVLRVMQLQRRHARIPWNWNHP